MEPHGLRDHTGNAWHYIAHYHDDPLTAICQAVGEVEQVLGVLLAWVPEPMFRVLTIYEEFRTKYRFSGGELVPLGAEEARDLLVEAINALLPLESEVEEYAYDGLTRNPFLILYRHRTTGEDVAELDEVATILGHLHEVDYLWETPSAVATVVPEAAREALLANLEPFLQEDDVAILADEE
jgi:hypothetical protein